MGDIDITERLRHEHLFCQGTDSEYQHEVVGRAADEIESLRALLDEASKVAERWRERNESLRSRVEMMELEAAEGRTQMDRDDKRIAAQEAEIERLRGALSALVVKLDQVTLDSDYIWGYLRVHGMTYSGANYAEELGVARRALEVSDE